VHEQLVEGIVVGDDDLMAATSRARPSGATSSRAPCQRGGGGGRVPRALRLGDHRVASTAWPAPRRAVPTPAERRPALVSAGESLTEVPCDPDGPPLLEVVRTLSDPHAGKVTIARSSRARCRRTSCSRTPVARRRTPPRPRVHQWVEHAAAHRGGGRRLRGDRASPTRRPATPSHPRPCRRPCSSRARVRPLAVAVRPASRADDDKLMSALARLCEETRPSASNVTTRPTRRCSASWGRSTSRQPGAPGQEVRRERRARELLIAYRETISAVASVEQSYKKQSGGHGQYAVVRCASSP